MLAAGLGNRELAPQVGLHAPVQPVRGQILVTERMQPFLRHPTLHVRQTGEGVVQIGDSKEEVGLDDGTTLGELARMARRATRLFPMLAGVNVGAHLGRAARDDAGRLSDLPGVGAIARAPSSSPATAASRSQPCMPARWWTGCAAAPSRPTSTDSKRSVSMFRPVDLPAGEQRRSIAISVEGRRVQAREGETLATALLTAGAVPLRRTAVSGAPRAPLCLMGVCFDCLVEVDGMQNVQSCMVEVREGMQVRLAQGARRPGDGA